jgi:hypothetical protein
MNLESLLVYGLVAAGGWLLRHIGIGAAVKVPGVAPAAPVAVAGRLPVMATLKADIDQIVKAAVESAIKQAIDDIKGAAVPQAPRPTP